MGFGRLTGQGLLGVGLGILFFVCFFEWGEKGGPG